jgi:hypothetical protein
MTLLSRITAIATLTLFSCKQNTDASTVEEAYKRMYYSFVYTKNAQQKFIDTAAECINTRIRDTNASIDTKRLTVLLDSARIANQSRLPIINSTEEIDDDIKYKARVLKYINLLDTLYNNEFVDYINSLESKSAIRLNRTVEVLYPRLEKLQEIGEAVSISGEQIRTKYKIKFVDSSLIGK